MYTILNITLTQNRMMYFYSKGYFLPWHPFQELLSFISMIEEDLYLDTSIVLWTPHVFILFYIQYQTKTTGGAWKVDKSKIDNWELCKNGHFYMLQIMQNTWFCDAQDWRFPIKCVTYSKISDGCVKVLTDVARFTVPGAPIIHKIRFDKF